jgi:hypothetical protein
MSPDSSGLGKNSLMSIELDDENGLACSPRDWTPAEARHEKVASGGRRQAARPTARTLSVCEDGLMRMPLQDCSNIDIWSYCGCMTCGLLEKWFVKERSGLIYSCLLDAATEGRQSQPRSSIIPPDLSNAKFD